MSKYMFSHISNYQTHNYILNKHIRSSSWHSLLVPMMIVLAIFIAGCGSKKSVTKQKTAPTPKQEIIQESPEASLLIRAARDQANNGDIEESARNLEKILEAFPGSAEADTARTQLARAYLDLGETKRALDLIEGLKQIQLRLQYLLH